MQNVLSKNLGEHRVPISCCRMAPEERRIRAVDPAHVTKIQDSLLEKKELSLITSKVLIGMIDINVEDFDEAELSNYVVEVLDGSHSLLAQKNAYEITSDDAFQYRTFCLYAKLSDEEVRMLGAYCNHLSTNVKAPTDFDYAYLLRRHLYDMCNLDEEEDPPHETPSKFSASMMSVLNLKTVRDHVKSFSQLR